MGPTKGLCGVNVRPVYGGCIEDIEDKQIKQRLQSQQVCILYLLQLFIRCVRMNFSLIYPT